MSALSSIKTTAPSLPSRVVLYAGEKWGKSSWGAFAPQCVFQMTAGETGLLSLMEAGQVPDTPHFPEATTWEEMVENVEALINDDHPYRCYVKDTVNGGENLLIDSVCRRSFNGYMKRFNQYGDGMKICVPEWARFLGLLDQLRTKRKMAIIFLAHAKVKDTTNPEGDNFGQFRPECNDKLYSLTHKWADVIAHGYWDIDQKKDIEDGKIKNAAARRAIYTQVSQVRVAGNRYGMRDKITANGGPESYWKAFLAELQAAKARGKKTELPPPPSETDKANEQAKIDREVDEDMEKRKAERAAEQAAQKPADPPPETPKADAPKQPDAPKTETPKADAAPETPKSEKITPARSQVLMKLIREQKLQWNKIRVEFGGKANFPLETDTLFDLTPDQGERLIALLEKKGAGQ